MGSNDDDSYRMFGQAAERIASLEAENARLRKFAEMMHSSTKDCTDPIMACIHELSCDALKEESNGKQ